MRLPSYARRMGVLNVHVDAHEYNKDVVQHPRRDAGVRAGATILIIHYLANRKSFFHIIWN